MRGKGVTELRSIFHALNCKQYRLQLILFNSYMEAAAYWEAQFHQPGVGYDSLSGLSYDGHGLP